MSAGGDEYGVVPLLEEIIHVVNPVIEAQLNPPIDDVLDFSFDDFRRQPVFGHAQAQHPAGHGHGFKDGHAISLVDQVLSGR